MNRIFNYLCIFILMGSSLVAVEFIPREILIYPETLGKPDSTRIKKLLTQKGVNQQLILMVGGISDSKKDTVFFLDMNGMQPLPIEEKEHAFVFGYEDSASIALSACLNRYSLITDLIFRQEVGKNIDVILGLENFIRSPELREAWYRLQQKKNFSGKRLFLGIDRQIQHFKGLSLEEWLVEHPDRNPADYYNFTIPEMVEFRKQMDRNFNLVHHTPEENTLDNWRNLYRDLFLATMLTLPENDRLSFKESYDFFRAEKPNTFAKSYLPFFNMMANWRFNRISKVIQTHYKNAQRYHLPFYILIEEPYVHILRKQLAAKELNSNIVDYCSILKVWGTEQEKEFLEATRYHNQRKLNNNHGNTASSFQRSLAMREEAQTACERKNTSAKEVIEALQKIQSTTQPTTPLLIQQNPNNPTAFHPQSTQPEDNHEPKSDKIPNSHLSKKVSTGSTSTHTEDNSAPHQDIQALTTSQARLAILTPETSQAQILEDENEIQLLQNDVSKVDQSPSATGITSPSTHSPTSAIMESSADKTIDKLALSQLGETRKSFQELAETLAEKSNSTNKIPQTYQQWWTHLSDEIITPNTQISSIQAPLSTSTTQHTSNTSNEIKRDTPTNDKVSDPINIEAPTSPLEQSPIDTLQENPFIAFLSLTNTEYEKDSGPANHKAPAQVFNSENIADLQKSKITLTASLSDSIMPIITYGFKPQSPRTASIISNDNYTANATPPSIQDSYNTLQNHDYNVPVTIAHESNSAEDLLPATPEEFEYIEAKKLGEDHDTFSHVAENDDSTDFDNLFLTLGPDDEIASFSHTNDNFNYVDSSHEEQTTMETRIMEDATKQNHSAAASNLRRRS